MRGIGAGLALGLVLPGVAGAAPRDTIGVFRDWGAFRAGDPPRCYAVARPPPGTGADGSAAAASVASFPEKRIRAQVSIRLSRGHAGGAPITLTIGDSGFALVPQAGGAFASSRLQDAQIVAAMRSGSSMSVSTVAPGGKPYADVYRLRGAATAIDAAMLACPLG